MGAHVFAEEPCVMKDVSRVCRSPLACTELGPLSHQERSVGYFDLLRAARYALTRSESVVLAREEAAQAAIRAERWLHSKRAADA